MDSHVIDRRLYRGRPGRVATVLNGLWARAAVAGLAPSRTVTLEVRGRTGRTQRVPVVVARYKGERYLVAMLGGQASWVRNVKPAEGDALLHRHRREAVHLEQVPGRDRAPILQEYLRLAPRGPGAHPRRLARPAD